MRIAVILPVAVFAFLGAVQAAPIHDAAKKGDTAAVVAAIGAGIAVDSDDGNATPLYYAVNGGHADTAKALLEQGADVNLSSRFGPPITIAAWKRQAALLRLLLEHGADPDNAFRTETALHMAAERGWLEGVQILVASGADVNALNSDREPPLHYAVKKKHAEVAAFLVASGHVFPQPPAIAHRLAMADVAAGEEVFRKNCRDCHDPEIEQRKFRGPPLWGISGRSKATYPGFNFSPALKQRGGNWTIEELNVFLADPARSIPGTDMGSKGVQDLSDRVNLIAYLETLGNAVTVPQP